MSKRNQSKYHYNNNDNNDNNDNKENAVKVSPSAHSSINKDDYLNKTQPNI